MAEGYKFTRADVLSEDLTVAHYGMIELFKIPVAEWNPDECREAIGCILGLFVALYTTAESRKEDLPNDLIADLSCAIGEIYLRIKTLGGHIHEEPLWRDNVKAILEAQTPQNIWNHKS